MEHCAKLAIYCNIIVPGPEVHDRYYRGGRRAYLSLSSRHFIRKGKDTDTDYDTVNVNNSTNVRNVNHLQKQAPSAIALGRPVVLQMDESMYNLTQWAQAHPGGASILQRYHGKNATRALFMLLVIRQKRIDCEKRFV